MEHRQNQKSDPAFKRDLLVSLEQILRQSIQRRGVSLEGIQRLKCPVRKLGSQFAGFLHGPILFDFAFRSSPGLIKMTFPMMTQTPSRAILPEMK